MSRVNDGIKKCEHSTILDKSVGTVVQFKMLMNTGEIVSARY